MKNDYQPPFTITPKILNLVAEISAQLGRITALDNDPKNIQLRRINRIRTIQGSLAIEGNTLSEEQIMAILEGKRVIAPLKEIQEVRNAIKTYDQLDNWHPHSQEDLLSAHKLLMSALLDLPGTYRTGGVGIMKGQAVVHMAPPADRVKYLMKDLFVWLKSTDVHPLVASSVFHYEFEFIHPFEDGNGRMGRLWQTLILSRWMPRFSSIPVESLVYEHQEEYYSALNESTATGNSYVFIEFMLGMIHEAVLTLATPEVAPQVTPEVKKLLSVIDGEMTRRELQEKMGLKDEKHFREAYIQPAVVAGLIEMTVPDKPNSRLQRYRLTHGGIKWRKELG